MKLQLTRPLVTLSKDFPADTCSVCYKLMEEFGGNNFDDNNY